MLFGISFMQNVPLNYPSPLQVFFTIESTIHHKYLFFNSKTKDGKQNKKNIHHYTKKEDNKAN